MRICLTDYKMYRPFKVTEVLPENDFKLQLPPGMHYYNSFNVSLLRKDPNDLLLGQRNPEPPPTRIGEYDEWLVEHIIASRRYRRRLEH